jgi:hypothetical protein
MESFAAIGKFDNLRRLSLRFVEKAKYIPSFRTVWKGTNPVGTALREYEPQSLFHQPFQEVI